MPKNILVTGFGPFTGHPINASWESVKLLPKIWNHEEVALIIDEIPVSYSDCFDSEKWAEHDPIFFIHVGVSSIAEKVTLEAIGHNTCYGMAHHFYKNFEIGNDAVINRHFDAATRTKFLWDISDRPDVNGKLPPSSNNWYVNIQCFTSGT